MASIAVWGPRGLGLHPRTASRWCQAPSVLRHGAVSIAARAATGKCFFERRRRRLRLCRQLAPFQAPASADHISLLGACVTTLGACRW
jgi:hypothetical protein